jgi:O-methyltransferase
MDKLLNFCIEVAKRGSAASEVAVRYSSNPQLLSHYCFMKKYRYVAGMLRAIPLFYKYRSRTMIPSRTFVENLAIMNVALANVSLKDGAVVECGTWKGGMAAAMIETGGPKRRYYFFDSFEGLPRANEIDGCKARRWQADTSSPAYFDNCRASLEDFQRTLEMTRCKPDGIEVHKGFFENTVSAFDCPPVAVLRLDADWYESTMICLEKFWDHVMPGGLILIDDYYDWEGCAKAVHAFLATRQAPERIYQGPIGHVAFIFKKDSLQE